VGFYYACLHGCAPVYVCLCGGGLACCKCVFAWVCACVNLCVW
jgi:hypothetical protein